MSTAAITTIPNVPMPTSAASSDQVSMEFEITSVDDDILHTVEKLFNFGRSGAIPYDTIQDILGRAIQAERNHWKDRLNSAMHEIERQHKVLLNEQSALQNLVGIMEDTQLEKNSQGSDRPKDLKVEERIPEENLSTEQLLENLKFKIEHLKQMANFMENREVTAIVSSVGKDNLKRKYSDNDIRYMKNAIAKIHWEKESLQNKVDQREKEIKWLQTELGSVKGQVKKLQEIVKEYNEDHTGAQFHLRDVEVPTSRQKEMINRERTYIEGDQFQTYPVPGEETALWKLRLRSQIYSTKKGNARTGITQCLRCQKLFKPSENNPKACRYHHKGREIKEQYDNNGRLLHVVYKWACCKKGLDAVGCATGFHI